MVKKHNKQRNTAFLYETLIIECTKASMKKDIERGKKIVGILKEFFSNQKELGKDLRLHQEVLEAKELDQMSAEKFLLEAKRRRDKLDNKKIFEQQTQLIGRIKNILGDEVFSNFIPNYRSIASVAQIFSERTPMKAKVLLENNILESMTGKKKEEKLEPVDNLVYSSFVKRFNEQYSSTLNEEQTKLISKYVMSINEGQTELHVFLNKEIGRLKEEVVKAKGKVENEQIKEKLGKLNEKLEGYKQAKPDDKMIVDVLKIQTLVREL